MHSEIRALSRAAHRLDGGPQDYDGLLDRIGTRRFVLLGESTHGTHQFYRERARLTRRLIAEKGFHAVAVEADWPDALRVSRFVTGRSEDTDAEEALRDFERFPPWMWRNADVLDFVGWLREHNSRHLRRVGFYGLDLYSLHRSMEGVVAWLSARDPEAAWQVQELFACFDRFDEDPNRYGAAAALGDSCAPAVQAHLQRLDAVAERTGADEEEAWLHARGNARVVQNAERYYRGMFARRSSTWNLRDTHMADTLDDLAEHIERVHGEPARIVVWAHNSHVGDARACAMADRGELSLGQLLRERHPDDTFLLGFSTTTGTVTAASTWGGPVERRQVRPAMEGSWEALFHTLGIPRFLLDCQHPDARGLLDQERLERAIGVVYRPETERASHLFRSRLGARFDALIHFETTRAVEPLERAALWEEGELPETWPSGL